MKGEPNKRYSHPSLTKAASDRHCASISLATKELSDPDEPQEEGDGHLLSYVADLPADVLDAVSKRHPSFEISHSLIAESDYYMTICECCTYGYN